MAASAKDVGFEVLTTFLPALARRYSDPELLFEDLPVYKQICAALDPRGQPLWAALAQHVTLPRSRRLFVANGALYLMRIGRDAQAFIAWTNTVPEGLPEPTFERLVEAGTELAERNQAPVSALSSLASACGNTNDFTGMELQEITDMVGRIPGQSSSVPALV